MGNCNEDFSSLILRQLKFGVIYPVVFFLKRSERVDEDEGGVNKTKKDRFYPGYGIELKIPGTATEPARINVTPGKASNCMIEFRRRRNPHVTSGPVKDLDSLVVVLLHSLENGQSYHLSIDSDLHMAVQEAGPSTEPHTWRIQYSGEGQDSEALVKELKDEQKAIEDVKAKYKEAADARKAVEDAEKASEGQKELMKAKHELLLKDLETKYFPDWVKERDVKLRFAENTGGAKGQKIQDEIDAKQKTMTNVLEMLALAMSPGTSLAFVTNMMTRDPELAPYVNQIWWLVAHHGVSYPGVYYPGVSYPGVSGI